MIYTLIAASISAHGALFGGIWLLERHRRNS